MSGMGTHARVTPEGLMTSTLLVTSKVRHLAWPEGPAAIALSGSLSPAAAAVDTPIPVLRNVRLSMKSPLLSARRVSEATIES
jgi:hypothetical protein